MKSLYESILDATEKKVKTSKKSFGPAIKQFLKENYKGTFTVSKEPNKDGFYVVTAKKAVILTNTMAESLTNGIFIFDDTEYDFICESSKIKTLQGAPKYVGGDFFCSWCHDLESLDGCPEEVYGNVELFGCGKLKNLIGGPNKVGRNFEVQNCKGLETLEGAPATVGGKFLTFGNTNLKTLGTKTQVVGHSFIANDCPNLVSVKGSPVVVQGDFNVNDCPKLTSLEGSPKKVGRLFCMNCTGIKTLKGMSQESYPAARDGFLDCSGTSITSLEGIPNAMEEVNCVGCTELKTLKGCPNKIAILDCNRCVNLENIDDIPDNMHYLCITGSKVTPEYAMSICKFSGGVE
jgi:hypothetical protein